MEDTAASAGAGEVCRTCLSAQALGPLFPEPAQYRSFQLALRLSTGLQMDHKDGLPQFLCKICNSCVEEFMLFRFQSRIANQKLKRCYNLMNVAESAFETNPLLLKPENLPTTPDLKLEAKSKLFEFYEAGISEHCGESNNGEDTSPVKFEGDGTLEVIVDTDSFVETKECDVINDDSLNQDINKVEIALKREDSDSNDTSEVGCDESDGESVQCKIVPNKVEIILENVTNDDLGQILEPSDDNFNIKDAILAGGNATNGLTVCMAGKRIAKEQIKDVDAYLCKICKETFKDIQTFLKHQCQKNCICEYCKEKFDGRSHLVRHMRKVHSQQIKPKVDQKTPDKANVTRTNTDKPHEFRRKCSELIDSAHDQGNDIKCRLCHNTYKDMRRFRLHAQRHLGYRNVCQYCQKGYQARYFLLKHIKKNHSGDVASKRGSEPPPEGNIVTKRQYSSKKRKKICGKEKKNVDIIESDGDEVRHSTHRDMDACLKHTRGRVGHRNVCQHCDKAYDSRTYLARHMRRRHPKVVEVVEGAGVPVREDAVIRNTDEPREYRARCLELVDGPHRQNMRDIRCKLCQNTYRDMDTFRRHAQKHLGYKNVCEFCHKGYQARFFLLRHVAREHTGARAASGPLRNTDRPEEFRRRCAELVDGEASHAHGGRDVRCRLCENTYRDMDTFRRHAQKHLGYRNVCEYCQKPYQARFFLLRHIQKHHLSESTESGGAPPPAERAGGGGERPDELRRRCLELIEGPWDAASRDVRCKVCGAVRKTVSSFVNHAQMHLGFRHLCEFCAKGYPSRAGLKRHLQAFHGMARELSCSYCDYKAIFRNQLKIHERRFHTKERPFVCETCGAAYFSKSVLTQHIQLRHQTERRYKCKECSRSFKLLRELTYHQKLVHQLACTYLCHICNSRFQAPRSVRNHYFKIHKIPRPEQVDKIQRFYFVQQAP